MGPSNIGLNIDAAHDSLGNITLPSMSFVMDQVDGLEINVGDLPIEIVTTDNLIIRAADFTVNGVRVADAGAGTDSASGPGSHSHGLTEA